jgi:hypothetical protein
MSYTIIVWEGARPATNEAAIDTADRLMARYIGDGAADPEQPGEPPTPAIRAYVDALLARWPDLTADDSDESPWADGPLINNAAGPVFCFALTFDSLEDSVPFVAAEARRLGLVCFDPQGLPYLLA